MPVEIFNHKLPEGQNAKFTIWRKRIGEQIYFHATVLDPLLLPSGLSEKEKEKYFGVNVTDGNQRTVYYSDHLRLKNDLLSRYGGSEWLQSEI